MPFATATDNCDADTSITIDCDNPATFPLGTTVVTCEATDSAGNVASSSFNVIVVDDEDPVLTVIPDITLSTDPGTCESAAAPTPFATATDNCGVAVTVCDPPEGSAFPVGTTVVSCTATDSAGNVATSSFNVIVVDDEVPVLTVAADSFLSTDPGACASTAAPTPFATATDNCPGVTFTCDHPEDTAFPVGSTPVVCTATDHVGLSTTEVFVVAVQDLEDPVFVSSQNELVSAAPGVCQSEALVLTYTVTDNCPGVTTTCDPASGSAFPVGTTPTACTAVDSSGNSASALITVDVTDDELPEWGSLPNVTVAACQGTAVSFSPAPTDNCPGVSGTCVPPSGSSFPVGGAEVTCTAADVAGNNRTQSFFVIVECDTSSTSSTSTSTTAQSDSGNTTTTTQGDSGSTTTTVHSDSGSTTQSDSGSTTTTTQGNSGSTTTTTQGDSGSTTTTAQGDGGSTTATTQGDIGSTTTTATQGDSGSTSTSTQSDIGSTTSTTHTNYYGGKRRIRRFRRRRLRRRRAVS